jgi:hypothetical protein
VSHGGAGSYKPLTVPTSVSLRKAAARPVFVLLMARLRADGIGALPDQICDQAKAGPACGGYSVHTHPIQLRTWLGARPGPRSTQSISSRPTLSRKRLPLLAARSNPASDGPFKRATPGLRIIYLIGSAWGIHCVHGGFQASVAVAVDVKFWGCSLHTKTE